MYAIKPYLKNHMFDGLYNYDLQPKTCLSDYIEAVQHTLKVWLALHTDREVWANDWSHDDICWQYKESRGDFRDKLFLL